MVRDLGCADERHGLRHGRPARGAGVGGGGPLALVRDGDWIELDVPNRRLTLDVSDEELAARRAAWTPPARTYQRGWGHLYVEQVMQADRGADLRFLLPEVPAAARSC